jgi:cyclophilin family peptidyl-prolyl cis-trans isomerase
MGFYSGTVFHRVLPGTVVQGGGLDRKLRGKPTLPPVGNESGNGLHNERGSVAAARGQDPNSATSQFFVDLADNLALRETTFSDVDIQIDALDVFANKGFAEFRVTATFSGPLVIGKEAAIEPNGHKLLLGAAAIADFEGGKIKALRAYFDDATLLEQMLAG